MSEFAPACRLNPDEQCVYCQAHVGPLGFAFNDGGMICNACYRRHVMGVKEAPVPVHSNTLASELKKHGLRIALYPEFRHQRYVLVCNVCSDATEMQPTAVVPGRCTCCGLTWEQTGPTFWVLVPKEKEPAG